MQYYEAATLIYVGSTKKGSGSPKEETITHRCKVKEIRNFSLNFYTSNGTLQRSMRKSKNLVVPMEMTHDRVVDNVRYELLYVEYHGLKYRVQNILNYYKSGIRMILDIEEVR